jgi:hypothetical protein
MFTMNEPVGSIQPNINTQSMMINHYSNTTKLVLGSFFTAFAVIFQSAGVFVGFGYALSILATLPIVLSSMMSLRIGFMSYFLTILLLALIQPSELLVFPLTTGLLGISLGIAFKWWKSWITITLFGGVSLSIGILILLYVLRFPILGPSISHTFDIKMSFIILIFSLLYSLIWMVMCQKVSRILHKVTAKRMHSK